MKNFGSFKILFSVLFLLFFCCQVQAQEDYVLHIGQDKTITEYKHTQLRGTWESLNTPFDWGIQRDGYFVNTWSYTLPGQGGYSLGSLGFLLTKDYGEYSFEEVQNLPVNVVYETSYDIVVDYYTGTSSNGGCHAFLYAPPFTMGADPMTPGVNVIDAVGPNAPQKEGGIHNRNVIYRVTSLNGEPLTVGNLPYLSVNVQSDCANYGDEIHSAAAALYLHRVSVQFPLHAIIHADVVSGDAPLTVQFKDASFGNPTSWLWDFGDGTTSTQKDPAHTFKSGIYSVTLTVSNGITSDTKTKQITVNENQPPIASFTYSPSDTPVVNDVLTFTSTSTDPDNSINELKYKWLLPNGLVSTDQTVTYQFLQTGTYLFKLTVTDPSDQSSTSEKQVVVVQPSFQVSPTSGNRKVVVNNPVTLDSRLLLPLQAFVEPTGGTYEWSIVNGADKVKIIGNPQNSAIQLQGIAPSKKPDDVELKVTYYYHSKSYSTNIKITVQKSTSLIERSPPSTVNAYDVYTTTYHYQVKDQFGHLINLFKLFVREDVTYSCTNSLFFKSLIPTNPDILQWTESDYARSGSFNDFISPITYPLGIPA